VIPVTTTICLIIYYTGGEDDKNLGTDGVADEVVSGQVTALYIPRLVE
jgi:hypothetical protein